MENINYTFDELYNRLPSELRQRVAITEQNPFWHPEGNVDVHIRLVFEYAKKTFKDINIMVAALFHDLGKTDTTFLKELKDGSFTWTSPRHELYAKGYIEEFISLYDDLDLDIPMIKEICFYHMKAHLYVDGTLKKRSKREAFENLKYFDEIMKFSECDTNGKDKI